MVLPLIKVFSLVVRVFSKPLISYTKQMHLKNEGFSHPYVRTIFIRLGNRYNHWETNINRKFMNVKTEYAYRELADNVALEKGIQFFYEILFYLIVIGLPVYQMQKASQDSKAKSKLLSQKIQSIEEKFKQITESIPKIQKLLAEEQKIDHKVQQLPAFFRPISLAFPNDQKHVYHMQYLL